MKTMAQVHDIRKMYYEKGESITQISTALQLDRKTIRKYIEKEDWNVLTKPKEDYEFCPKLDPFKPTIDEWLEDDKQAKRKQRHTAKRVYDRLIKAFPKSFSCSYRTVATYVGVRKKEIFGTEKQSFIPLEHQYGEAQVDFGAAQFYENGKLCDGKYLEITFPKSNKGYLQLFYGENLECLLEGMHAIFVHIGGVPTRLWFDNTKTIVTKIIKGGGRELTQGFSRFTVHYRFDAVFCSPYSGNQKGCVENKVGYHRRNLLVPIPRFHNLEDYNRELFYMCEEDALRSHYRLNATIEELFQSDKNKLLELPSIPLDLAKHKDMKTNGYARFYLEKGKHEYSSAPKCANGYVHLRISANFVIVQDENYREIVRHPRFYGSEKQQSMKWVPYLKQLSLRPRALKYSGIYTMMPAAMQSYLTSCTREETGKILRTLSELTDKSGFDSAVNTISYAMQYGAKDVDSLLSLYRRLYADVRELPPLPLKSGIPELQQMSVNLSVYDTVLTKGAINHAGK